MATYAFTTTDNDFTLTVNGTEVGTWDKTEKADHAYKVDITGPSVILSFINPYYSATIIPTDTVTIDEEAQGGTMTDKGEAIKDAVYTAGGGAVEVTVLSRTITLTNDQIKALASTPVELVPAPGADKIAVFHCAIWRKPSFAAEYTGIEEFDGITIGYDGGNSGLNRGLWLDTSAGVTDLSNILNDTIANDVVYYDAASAQYANGWIRPQIVSVNDSGVNKALILKASTTNPAWGGGHASNTLEVTVEYSIVDL